MRFVSLSNVGLLALMASGVAFADERASFSALSDIEIVSVIPRSAEVKPLAMSVPAEGRKDVSLAQPTGDAPAAPTGGKLASADRRAAVPSRSGDKQ
jgi:hypothetical protein